MKRLKAVSVAKSTAIDKRIRDILESARANAVRSVNTTQVVSNWLIGREIVEEEQRGKDRAEYGKELLKSLSSQLNLQFRRGFSVSALQYMRSFYLTYPELLEKQHALRFEFNALPLRSEKQHSLSVESTRHRSALLAAETIGKSTAETDGWKPGRLNSDLSWTHYRTLLRVEFADARNFYEIESIRNNWSAREMERQINSLLFERLAKSKDKVGLMRLATNGQEISQPADIFKDPVVIEFLGLPESPQLTESDLESALIDNLRTFLLELGKGFAFVSRQERITLDGDHFYIDLVFYHTILKCYVLIDLKIDKLTHADLGQLLLYVNYYDHERCTPGDNPTLGLILCTDKIDAVVKYTLGTEQPQKIFASRYKLYLPSEADLQEEIRREVRQLATFKTSRKSRK